MDFQLLKLFRWYLRWYAFLCQTLLLITGSTAKVAYFQTDGADMGLCLAWLSVFSLPKQCLDQDLELNLGPLAQQGTSLTTRPLLQNSDKSSATIGRFNFTIASCLES